jgi:hypothetical protein
MNHYYNTTFIRKNKHLNAYECGQIKLLYSKGLHKKPTEFAFKSIIL